MEAIRYRMEQADLALVLGSRLRASKMLSRRRALTKEQAFKPHRAWHIPAEVLIQPHHVEAGAS